MRITKTTIALLILCFFTVQLKAKELLPAPGPALRPNALQEALELILKDLDVASPKLLESSKAFNPLPPLLKTSKSSTTKSKEQESATKLLSGKRKKPAPIVSPAKFRFGISDKEI